MIWRHRLAALTAALTMMLGVAGCSSDDDSDGPGQRGDNSSAVGEPGNEESETGGGGAPAEGVDDGSDEN